MPLVLELALDVFYGPKQLAATKDQPPFAALGVLGLPDGGTIRGDKLDCPAKARVGVDPPFKRGDLLHPTHDEAVHP